MTTVYIVATTIEMSGHASTYTDQNFICAKTEAKAKELAVDIIKKHKFYEPTDYMSFKEMEEDNVDLSTLIGMELTDGDDDTYSATVAVIKSKLVQ